MRLAPRALMGRLLLQMMSSLDGMIQGPKGDLDWIATDEKLNQAHLAILKDAALILLGSGAAREMSGFWQAAEKDQHGTAMSRDLGRGMNEHRKVIYSHGDLTVDWRNAETHVVADDRAFVEDVKRVKDATRGTIVTYGGVRLARSLLEHALVDELHLDVCPIVLGGGERLFTDTVSRTQLRLKTSERYESGATLLHYEMKNTA